MVNHLIKRINKVTFLGIERDEAFITQFRKRVLNRTFFIIGLTALIFITEGIFFGKKNVYIVPLFFLVVSVVLLFVNAQKKFHISCIVLTFLLPTMFLGVMILYGATLKMDYTISFFIVLVLTLYDDTRLRVANVLYLLLLQTFSLYYTSNYESHFAEYVDAMDSLIVLTATTLGLFILVYQFIRQNKNFLNQQQALNLDLDKKNRELQEIILEKEKLNRELREKSNDLQQANDFLESYTYISSHDLKTPVRNINSFSDLLEKELQEVKHQNVSEYLGFIKSGAMQINSILDGIIENAASNRSSLELEPVDCNHLIADIRDRMQFRLEEENGQVLHTSLPTVFADKMMLRKIFLNLIDNGLKYNGSDRPTVKICYQQQEDLYLFSVIDNGIGIHTRYSDDIFKMFKKLHGINEFSGSGVGLALCRKMIDLHGGKIWLKNNQDHKGSTFQFTLPVRSD